MKILRIPLVIVLLVLAGRAFNAGAQTVTILYSFGSSPTDGVFPYAGLVQGSDGNFYGTTRLDSEVAMGTVFRISPGGSYSSLYSFFGNSDGGQPVAGLVQGSDSNFYGTTWQDGGVFRISPSGNETNLYTFGSSGDGCPNGDTHSCDGYLPVAGLVQGSDGNFYGTTSRGGTHCGDDICDLGCGTVFRISPSGTYTSLYSFGSSPTDGNSPFAGLVQGSDGNFYGTTSAGGTSTNCSYEYGGCGTVFRISPSGTEMTLYSFVGFPTDGGYPQAGLVQGSDGNFYGTTSQGGTSPNCNGKSVNGKSVTGCGTIFRISPSGNYTNLYSFVGYPSDGYYPEAGLVQGRDGNFYGTTYGGGTNGEGTVFRISPSGTYTSLYSFVGDPNDGANPWAGLVQGGDGNFYGTTKFGGINGYGTVFKFSLCNSNFMPQVSAIQIVGTNVVITLPTVTCQTYQLQYSEWMVPTNWINTGSVAAGTGSPIQLIDVGGGLETQRFYRVEIMTGGSSISSIAGETYQLQFSSSLNPTNWVNEGSTMTSIGSVLTLTNFAGANQSQGFYRFAITP